MASSHNTIESFYKAIAEGKLVAGKCRVCNKLLVPPRPLCPHCYSSNFEEVVLKGKGKLLSYTIIHVAPPQFRAMAPYTVGIVELEEGPRILGVIHSPSGRPLKIGQEMTVSFDTNVHPTWPKWPRYFFKPAEDVDSKSWTS
ncbi:MAG: Zn-ribbon domain-containing OB-fold protein [Candidatus Bathyarchaeia archaeon]